MECLPSMWETLSPKIFLRIAQFKRKENMISTLGFNKYVRSHVQRHMLKSQQCGREATAGGSQEARSLSRSTQQSRTWSRTKNFQCVAGSSCTSVTTKQLPGPSMLFSALPKACFETNSHRTTEGGMSLLPIILLSHFSTKTTLGALPMISANPVAQFSAYLS